MYNNKAPDEKMELLRVNQACLICLKVRHRSADHKSRKKCYKESCDKYHHTSLHEPHSQGVAFHTSTVLPKVAKTFNKESNACLL